MARYTLLNLRNHVYYEETARELLENIAYRLTLQSQTISSQLLSKPHLRRSVEHNLHHVLYIHNDTFKICQQVCSTNVIFQRWSLADQYVVKATAEQIRSRHATSLERWVDVIVDADDDNREILERHVLPILQRRLGIQILCDHIVKLSTGSGGGAVSVNCSLQDVLEDAIAEANHVCDAHLQMTPHVELDNTSLRLDVVRPWLLHALVEVLKNGMAASVEQGKRNGSIPPAIQIHSEQQANEIVVEIVDHGVGLPVSDPEDAEQLLFGIGQSTASKRWDRLSEQQSYAAVRSPLTSFGVGLPASRMMMRHWGGTVEVVPRDGGGCTARLRLMLDYDIPEPEVVVNL